MARILIIEDNQANMDLMAAVIRVSGHEPLQAYNGDQAREILRGDLPDLVLVDFALPGDNGDVLIREVRADPRTADLPVVAVSASVLPHQRHVLLDAGANAFCEKPIRVGAFLKHLELWLQGTFEED